jgi:plasmid stabilization system protein ParE
MRVWYTDRAKDDVELAFVWYEKQRSGLGFTFLESIERALKNIIAYPEMYPMRYLEFHSCTIKRFPFSIFYTYENDEIVIHSVFDNRQDPEKKPE